MLEVMRCLDEELKQVPAPDLKAYKVIRVLLDARIKALEQGDFDPQTFDRPALLKLCETRAKAATTDPTRWLNRVVLDTFLAARKTSILARLERKGVSEMPVIGTNDGGGGSGNQRLFWLDTRVIENGDFEPALEQPAKHIVYMRTDIGEVKPAWILRLIFKKGELKNRSLRGLSLLLMTLAGMLFFLLWLLVAFWSIAEVDQALTFRQLTVALFICGCAWLIWHSFYNPWIRLLDDRVIKASSALLSILEDPAELEMYRDSEKDQWTRFVRFSGDCPLCSGRVLLMSGKPEHKLPLVGRCSESPHSHVFSFDRVRLVGVYIGPPVA